MTLPSAVLARLQFLMRVIEKERRHLLATDQRLFATPFDEARALTLENDLDLAERVEAFAGRFGRLQDTLADKLLPILLAALGERVASQLDNLDRAERLGLIDSVDMWMGMRQLRNQMVHEYIEDRAILANALQAGHSFVPILTATAEAMMTEICKRGWDKS